MRDNFDKITICILTNILKLYFFVKLFKVKNINKSKSQDCENIWDCGIPLVGS